MGNRKLKLTRGSDIEMHPDDLELLPTRIEMIKEEWAKEDLSDAYFIVLMEGTQNDKGDDVRITD